MSRINSSVGLITGIPIEETVAKLMQIAAKPRDLLKSRNDGLKQQQSALDAIGSRLLGFQFALNKLKASTVFETRTITSNNADALTASAPAAGTPVVGSYQVQPIQVASAQQILSRRFDSAAEALAGGSFTFRLGGHVDRGQQLAELNGGAGVQRGKIRITDRSGAATTVDLSFALTVDDVVTAINDQTDVAVTASTRGDSFTLTDHSGGVGNLRVQDVGGGSTAAGLGLAGINIAADQAEGADVLWLHAGTKLARLNDGTGVDITKEDVVDLEVTLRSGAQLSIDLHDATTLGDVVTQINAASPTRLKAAISDDGRRLELTDLTSGTGNFRVANGAASSAADALGIAGDVTAATIAGDRLIAGLQDTLLGSLNGGRGVGALGQITITDRDGATGAVNLAAAETLNDVIDAINAAAPQVTAAFNEARNGIVVTDDSGGTGKLTVGNADATNAATKLKLLVSSETASVNSGSLGKQTIGRATLLSSLNGGKGVTLGDIRIIDSAGVSRTADLDRFGSQPRTFGDVIDAINSLSNGVEARINDAGDGIVVVDTANGSGALSIQDTTGTIAKSLHLTRASKTITIDGQSKKAIDGTTSYKVSLDDLTVDAESIALASLNGGKGVAAGDVTIVDSQGKSIGLDLNGADASITTVGQLIEAINERAEANGMKLTARVNDAGTGIQLEDNSGGSGKLEVRDVNSTTAADLKLKTAATKSGSAQTINGAGAFPASTASTGLDALAARINDLKAGVTASAIFDGLGYRLSLVANSTGTASALGFDNGDAGLQLEEVSEAQDALLLYGNFTKPGAGVLLSSGDGNFASAIGGVDVTVKAPSDAPVTISVAQTDSSLVEAIEDVVESYNSLRTDLGKLTTFDEEAAAVGLLFGSNEALQVDSRLSQALTSRYFGAGSIQSLETIGLSLKADGTLELNSTKLRNAFTSNPDAVEQFFTDANSGVVKKLTDVIDRLAGAENSLLAARSDALQDSIKANDERLTKFQATLDRQEERMLTQFYQLESVIAKLQSSLTAIQNLQVIPPLGR